MVLATIVACIIVDKVGRKIMLILSGIVMGFCNILLGIYFDIARFPGKFFIRLFLDPFPVTFIVQCKKNRTYFKIFSAVLVSSYSLLFIHFVFSSVLAVFIHNLFLAVFLAIFSQFLIFSEFFLHFKRTKVLFETFNQKDI